MRDNEDLFEQNREAAEHQGAVDADGGSVRLREPDQNTHAGMRAAPGISGASEVSEATERSQPSEVSRLSGDGVTRREMLKITAGAVIAAPLVGAGLKANAATPVAAADGKAPLFFTAQEFAMVDELTELIIPTDDHSPGARAAGCAAFIDSQLAEAWDPKSKDHWREGLNLVNQLSQEMGGKTFMEASTEQRIAVLTRMARIEKPEKPEQQFFRELKSRTAHAYYTSKIGIHQELEYKGNTYQKEFSGFEAT
jgi:hypothetical protein